MQASGNNVFDFGVTDICFRAQNRGEVLNGIDDRHHPPNMPLPSLEYWGAVGERCPQNRV